MALGAQPRNVLGLVIGQALKLCGVGLAVALPIAFALSWAMAGLVFGVVSLNLAILAGFAALLTVVALAAGFVPGATSDAHRSDGGLEIRVNR